MLLATYKPVTILYHIITWKSKGKNIKIFPRVGFCFIFSLDIFLKSIYFIFLFLIKIATIKLSQHGLDMVIVIFK